MPAATRRTRRRRDSTVSWSTPGNDLRATIRPKVHRSKQARPAGLSASARCSLAELLAQAIHRLGLAAHAEECSGVAGPLLEHRAGGEDLAAPLLRPPAHEHPALPHPPLA